MAITGKYGRYVCDTEIEKDSLTDGIDDPEGFECFVRLTPSKFYKYIAGAWQLIAGAVVFTDKQDSLPALVGNALKVMRVKVTEDGYEYITLTGGGDMLNADNLAGLTDFSDARDNLGVTTLLAGKSDTGHTHTSSNITDFTEAVQDAVAALLGAGSNITLNYNDALNTLEIVAAGSSFDPEAVRDAIGVALVGAGNISVSVNDALDTITISTTATVNDTNAALRDRGTHTGTQDADTITDGTTNKVFTATEKTKLAGIAAGATVNSIDAFLLDRGNHTGTQSADSITDGTTNKAYTATEKTKLAGIAAGATANDTDANLKNRANHSGTQLASTISDFQTQVSANSDVAAMKAIIGAGISDGDGLVDTLSEMLDVFTTYSEGVDIAAQLAGKSAVGHTHTASNVTDFNAAALAAAPAETAASVAALHHAASIKTGIIDADEVTGGDSANSFSLIRTPWSSVKSFLKTYFDTIYIISDLTISTTDITTNNVSTSKHGFAPKASGVATEFLNGLGAYSTPAPAQFSYVQSGDLTLADNCAIITPHRYKVGSTNFLKLAGSSNFKIS